MAQTIVTKELAIRAAIENIADENTLLIKDSRSGRTYIALSLGNNLELDTRDTVLYIDAPGIPIYDDPGDAPVPPAGYVTRYFLTGDYDFMYLKWPDDSDHNRRVPLSWISM